MVSYKYLYKFQLLYIIYDLQADLLISTTGGSSNGGLFTNFNWPTDKKFIFNIIIFNGQLNKVYVSFNLIFSY